MGDVSTDSDWWGNSATPCSLAAGHGLISLDESHWHLSYLNDYVYLSISPLLPLASPPALGLAPASSHSSEITVEFTHTPSQDDTALCVCAAPLDGSWFLLPGVPLQVAAKRDLGANENIFFIDDRCGAAVSDSQSLRHVAREANIIQIETHLSRLETCHCENGNMKRVCETSIWMEKKVINFHGMLSHDVMVVPAFCWRVWSVFKVLPWQEDKQMLRDVWPVSWWRAVGILKSHFLVFKRHPSRFDSGFLSSLTAAVQSVASQVLSGCILRCFKGPFGCHFERL